MTSLCHLDIDHASNTFSLPQFAHWCVNRTLPFTEAQTLVAWIKSYWMHSSYAFQLIYQIACTHHLLVELNVQFQDLYYMFIVHRYSGHTCVLSVYVCICVCVCVAGGLCAIGICPLQWHLLLHTQINTICNLWLVALYRVHLWWDVCVVPKVSIYGM